MKRQLIFRPFLFLSLLILTTGVLLAVVACESDQPLLEEATTIKALFEECTCKSIKVKPKEKNNTDNGTKPKVPKLPVGKATFTRSANPSTGAKNNFAFSDEKTWLLELECAGEEDGSCSGEVRVTTNMGLGGGARKNRITIFYL